MKQAVSFSGLKKYEQCPHQFYRTKVKKDIVEDFSHPAAVWGNEVHAAFEYYLKNGTPLGDRFAQYQKYVERLSQIPGEHYVELKLAMNANDQIVQFSSKDAAYRAIIDFLVVRRDKAFLIDHKTGKIRPTAQLHFNALLIFTAFPDVEEIKAAFFWVKDDTYTKHTFRRDDIDDLWSKFEPTLVRMEESFETGNWPKRKTGLCPWCPVADCEFRNT